ncbi:13125_t:CDS:2 [Funneliformis caledonium]|uniref:13125_t:CDS:1 n=1 Tax=Funneliformis caledonium TaxID=1117310 RepID=A0A9N9N6G8_9GLOM|nr:13125_t:CDS:2 [Funneliformis caledonium]
MKSPEINLSEYQNERDDRDLDKERDDDDYSLKLYDQPQPINENDDFNNFKDIEIEYDELDHLSSDLETLRKCEHDMDDIIPMQTNKKILFKEHLESYVEKHSKGYIKDIGKHRWDSRFYSEFMTICLEKMCHRRSAIAKDIQLALFKVFPEVPKIKANTVDDTGLPTINTIIMKAMPREDKEERLKSQQIPTEDDDLKDDDRSNDYNSTVEEKISEENHYESEDAILFE